MDNATSNRLSAIDATLNFLENNSDKTALLPGFAAVKAVVDGKRSQISDNIIIAQSGTKGVTLDKKKARLSMCEKAFKIGCAVSAYAAVIHDNTLLDKVKFTLPTLMRIDNDEIVEICQTIHDEGATHLVEAGNYGYTAADVISVQDAITSYEIAKSPRDRRIEIKQANANIKLQVKEVNEILKEQMDPMINTLRTTEPNFVAMYIMSREIINRGIIHTQVKGTVKDNEDKPLSGVTLTVADSTTGGTVGTIRTEEEGKFKLRLVPGNYDLTWTMNNFQPVTELNVRFIQGKMVTRKVVLLQAA